MTTLGSCPNRSPRSMPAPGQGWTLPSCTPPPQTCSHPVFPRCPPPIVTSLNPPSASKMSHKCHCKCQPPCVCWSLSPASGCLVHTAPCRARNQTPGLSLSQFLTAALGLPRAGSRGRVLLQGVPGTDPAPCPTSACRLQAGWELHACITALLAHVSIGHRHTLCPRGSSRPCSLPMVG